ncbi:RNA binding domain-containing protein painting of fourth [Rhynchophorus ferrugineus]|uniref:RNA binding domain-containing protein painting of fourth n=1 Tax=Rhynchophorus ferrugineus TaxID=354439 RepID=UPI003FCD4AC3
MNSSSGNSGQANFDFSQPPPGYTPYRFNTPKKYTANSKTENYVSPGYNTPRASPNAAMGLYMYYDSTDVNLTKNAKSRPITTPTPPVNYNNLQSANDLYAQIRQPPPPPPAVPYPSNSEVQHAPQEVYLYSGVYNSYNIPPPNVGNSIGARQSQQQEEYQQQYRRDYNNGYYNRGGYNNPSNRKRKLPQELDPKKSIKKKKKPLSQNIPMRKDWSVDDAKRALDVEKEYHKRHKSQSLIIKFPDLELNRDIVSKFHSQIDSVHFQLPSNPRFCFVTLKDNANMDEVIKELNKIKFGYGYLTVEPKRDREDDVNIGPEDIDPLTLYVGNLAQEVTVDDVVKVYPKNKRIDIGFAKKMKYTRYAFVCFHTVNDAIEAFQNTYATEMYSKSLIVRFRRLHGTVGLPGETKQASQRKTGDNTSASDKGMYTDHDFWKEQVDAMGIARFKQEVDDSELFDDFHDIDLPNLYETSRKASNNDKYDSDSCNSDSSHENNRTQNPVEDNELLGIRVKEEPPDESVDVEDDTFAQLMNTNKEPHTPLVEVRIKDEIDRPSDSESARSVNTTIVKQEVDWDERDRTSDVLMEISKHSDGESDIDDSFFNNLQNK